MNNLQQTDQLVDIPIPVPAKNYLLMVDDLAMAFLSKICSGIQYVEIIGMPIKENDQYQLLANPLPPKPIPPENVVPVDAPDTCCPQESVMDVLISDGQPIDVA